MCVRAVQICNTKILYEVKDMVIAQWWKEEIQF